MDLKRDGTITLKDFIRTLKDYRIEITEQEIHLLLASYSKGLSAILNYNDFMKSLLGTMNEYRRKLVDRLYNCLDRNHKKYISIEEFSDKFDPTGHPEVLNNKRSKG